MTQDPVKAGELRYYSKALNLEDVAGEVRAFWSELEQDAVLRDRVAAEGFDVDRLREARGGDAISVRKDEAGFGPATTAIIIAFAPVAAGITRDLWKKIILPRIERRYGPGSLHAADPQTDEAD